MSDPDWKPVLHAARELATALRDYEDIAQTGGLDGTQARDYLMRAAMEHVDLERAMAEVGFDGSELGHHKGSLNTRVASALQTIYRAVLNIRGGNGEWTGKLSEDNHGNVYTQWMKTDKAPSFEPELAMLEKAVSILNEHAAEGEPVAPEAGGDAAEDGPAELSGDDPTSYVPMKELWPERFTRADQCTRFLDSHQDKIRQQKPSKRRRLIHAGDWHHYWKEHDRQQSELLDNEALQETLADIEARKGEEQVRKNSRK